jgi:hypothetical protein
MVLEKWASGVDKFSSILDKENVEFVGLFLGSLRSKTQALEIFSLC